MYTYVFTYSSGQGRKSARVREGERERNKKAEFNCCFTLLNCQGPQVEGCPQRVPVESTKYEKKTEMGETPKNPELTVNLPANSFFLPKHQNDPNDGTACRESAIW